MINYEEELKKFKPCLDVDEIESAVYTRDLTDIVDILQGSILGHHDHIVPHADGVIAAGDQDGPVPADNARDEDAGLQLQVPQGRVRQGHALVHVEF